MFVVAIHDAHSWWSSDPVATPTLRDGTQCTGMLLSVCVAPPAPFARSPRPVCSFAYPCPYPCPCPLACSSGEWMWTSVEHSRRTARRRPAPSLPTTRIVGCVRCTCRDTMWHTIQDKEVYAMWHTIQDKEFWLHDKHNVAYTSLSLDSIRTRL